MVSSPLLILFFFLMILGTLVPTIAAASQRAELEASTNFILTSCKAGNPLQDSPREMAHAALLVSLAKARSLLWMLGLEAIAMGRLSHREVSAMKVCVENVADSIDMLKQSLGEMENLNQKRWGLQMNDPQTWVSATLTNADTCTDGFAGKAMDGPVKESIRASIFTMA